MDFQVIVVGAGPVGLLLAGLLRRGDVDVVVLEHLAEATGESRASQLNARTMEVLDQGGLLGRLGRMDSVDTGHFGGIPVPAGGVASRFPGFWKMPQFDLEAALTEWVTELGADVRRRHTVQALTDTGERVRVEVDTPGGPVTLHAAWVIGCDGQDSTVRDLAGIAFPGQAAERELLRADVDDIAIADRHFERHENGLAIAHRRSDGVTRVMFHEFGRPPVERTGPPSFDEIVDGWRRVTSEDIGAGRPLWTDAFDDASRQARQYRRGRVLLAGDAAHRQIPAAGQALNLGLQDADNLGWKLTAVVRGEAGDELLDTYHTERHSVGADVMDNVRAQTLLLLGGEETDSLRTVIGEIATLPEGQDQLAAVISGLDVRYSDSSDAKTARATSHPLVGMRLPDIEVPTTRGLVSGIDVLRRGHGLLLDLAGAVPPDRIRGWAERVEHVAAAGRVDALGPELASVLVRPDGHVAWISLIDDVAAGLEEALRRWFGRHRDELTTITGVATRSAPAEKGIYMGTLEGKSALVTGSSRGIGRAIAERLGREGALVVVHYSSDADAADQAVKSIVSAGGRAFAVQAEFGVADDVNTLHRKLEAGLREQHGSVSLDILVNNAGIMGSVNPEDITPEQFDRLVAVNAKAPLFLVQRLLPLIPEGGRIVNISSGLTRFANPSEIAYAMTKGAIEQVTLHYARHLGPRNITVNSVGPGVTKNGNPVFDVPEAREQIAQLSAFSRIGEPADVGDIVAFVCSPDARWMTGTFVDASGGALLG
ncbi:monooxygenase (plasmid) [Pseudonocardia sp. EC080610-09]|uniref:SDR family oxidoreductase n=1 Tax=unclassified Pseudonocardia TaxID=2619320 RepID=UPI00070629F2|nr:MULTISPECIES: SDR family oxidoreductase [unclassified Pseudonocardia]ALL79479.1 monooxygenase [Pseudonocardia sp. EC080610-09]ALL85568.1 monooxygenase [Pseudonocardia sp. EC080619-01]